MEPLQVFVQRHDVIDHGFDQRPRLLLVGVESVGKHPHLTEMGKLLVLQHELQQKTEVKAASAGSGVPATLSRAPSRTLEAPLGACIHSPPCARSSAPAAPPPAPAPWRGPAAPGAPGGCRTEDTGHGEDQAGLVPQCPPVLPVLPVGVWCPQRLQRPRVGKGVLILQQQPCGAQGTEQRQHLRQGDVGLRVGFRALELWAGVYSFLA